LFLLVQGAIKPGYVTLSVNTNFSDARAASIFSIQYTTIFLRNVGNELLEDDVIREDQGKKNIDFCSCYMRTMFPLRCAGVRPRSNCNSPVHIELLARSWNFSIFIVNILIILQKMFLKCCVFVRSCKNFLLRAVTSPCSCKKNQRERCMRK
jgi:hypothetical protein